MKRYFNKAYGHLRRGEVGPLLQAVIRVFIRKMRRRLVEKRDSLGTTYHTAPAAMESRWFDEPVLFSFFEDQKRLNACEDYLAHRFNLLGSGPVVVEYGMVCQGFGGHVHQGVLAVQVDGKGEWLSQVVSSGNLKYAGQLWQMVDAGYVPIDWQLDFKSGYRWGAHRHVSRVRFGHLPGVDIKVPWELARLQHLPQLALQFSVDKEEKWLREFRNQCLDFMATNPPRFGVNWACTMDVAIRGANIMLAYQLFLASKAKFDKPFEDALAQAMMSHAEHIVNHLEKIAPVGNHYLADIAGLLFITAGLKPDEKIKSWFTYAACTLAEEIERQFDGQGTNFEASTAYHRFSAETAVFSFALLMGGKWQSRWGYQEGDVPSDKTHRFTLPSSPKGLMTTPVSVRLRGMAEFSKTITKPDDTIHQVGDNDSGRFFNLTPQPAHVMPLDHGGLVESVERLFGLLEKPSYGESALVAAFIGNRTLREPFQEKEKQVSLDDKAVFDELHKRSKSVPEAQRAKRDFRLPDKTHKASLTYCAFEDFGLYMIRGKQFYLALRCGGVGQEGHGGHAHVDQLAMELCAGRENIVRDPGTFVYTPLPKERNVYRKATAHFVPILINDKTQQPLPLGNLDETFRLPDTFQAELLYFGKQGMVAVHHGYGVPVYRLIELKPSTVHVTDWVEDKEYTIRPMDDYDPPVFSPGYGLKE